MTKSKLSFVISLFSLLILFLITSCTFTTTSEKGPIFNKDNSIIESELKTIVTCEKINLNAKEVKTNEKTTSELEVRIINGSNIPTANDQIKELARSVAILFKRSLKNPDDFDTYKILFVTEQTNGGITNSTYTGHVFKSEEL